MGSFILKELLRECAGEWAKCNYLYSDLNQRVAHKNKVLVKYENRIREFFEPPEPTVKTTVRKHPKNNQRKDV